MKRILITGATGNVGKAVIKGLLSQAKDHLIIAGVRNVEKDGRHFSGNNIQLQHFDFEDDSTHQAAFLRCDILFFTETTPNF